MHQVDDPHSHRDPEGIEEPLDAANQSLSDALRTSFRILKGIMIVLIVLFLFSNVRRIESHEQALMLRFGGLLPGVKDSGLVWALPFPVDEIVSLPTKQSNALTIDSHSFLRRPDEVGKPLAFIQRGVDGLSPALDGALITADAGLVHVQWKITYKVDDVRAYVSNVVSRDLESGEKLIRTFVETVGIEVAGEHTAEEMIRTRVDEVQSKILRRVNERLAEMGSGLILTHVEMFEPTPPIRVRDAFDNTQRAENAKQKRIREAEETWTKTLNEAAGAAYPRVLEQLDALEKPGLSSTDRIRLQGELNLLLETKVEGKSGRMIKDAGAYLSRVVGRMQSDVELYRTLVPEFERNPALLIARLWEQAKQELLLADGVTKLFRPFTSQVRLKIPYDAEQARIEEENRLQSKESDMSKIKRERLVPVGPERE